MVGVVEGRKYYIRIFLDHRPSSLITGLRYHGRYPPHVVGHTSVDAVLAPSAASVTETGHSHHRPPATHLAQQRSTRIAGTRVRPSVSIPRTEHVVRDPVPPVRGPARPLSHDWHLLTILILVCII